MSTSIIFVRALVLVLFSVCLRSLWKAQKLSSQSVTWEEMLRDLSPIRMEGLRVAAGDVSAATKLSIAAYTELYDDIGGKEGIRRMKHNADVLIRLAAYTETWSPGISSDVVRQMREAGFRLKKAAWKMAVLSFCAKPSLRSTLVLREVARSYSEIVISVLSLYAKAHVSKHSLLYAACGI